MICLSAHSNYFSLLHNQTDCTGSPEIAAYVTGSALEVTDGISLLQNTTYLLHDRYTAKQRIFLLFSDEKQEIYLVWCPTSLWKTFASHKMEKNGCNYLLAGMDTTLLKSKGCHSSKIANKFGERMRMKMNSPLLIMWEWITGRIEALLCLYQLIKFRAVKVSGNWMKGRKTSENCSFQLTDSEGEGILDGGFCCFNFFLWLFLHLWSTFFLVFLFEILV